MGVVESASNTSRHTQNTDNKKVEKAQK